MDDKIVAMLCISALAVVAMWFSVGDGILVAAITGIAGLAGYQAGKAGSSK